MTHSADRVPEESTSESGLKVADRPRGLKSVASAGLAALFCAALASCSAPVAPPDGQAAGNAPDLEVALAVSDGGPVAGAQFTLGSDGPEHR